MAIKKARCPKCDRYRKLTKHHYFPRRFFGNGTRNNDTIELCRECHDELEELIPFEDVMPKSFYINVVEEFLAT